MSDLQQTWDPSRWMPKSTSRGLVQDSRAPIDKASSLTPRCNTTELLPSSICESGTYHGFLLACPQGARKEDCWMEVVGTKEKPIGVWTISPSTSMFSLTGITPGLYLLTLQEHARAESEI
ncbi:hypothetical protein EDB86DRAFT_2830606 [Lactarius hatsudake]|nr:hypothetical protein EDB86DRAFT_2830606 [Lactarius hatsudake]